MNEVTSHEDQLPEPGEEAFVAARAALPGVKRGGHDCALKPFRLMNSRCALMPSKKGDL